MALVIFLVRCYQMRTWWLQLVQTTGVWVMKTACNIFRSLDPPFHIWHSKGILSILFSLRYDSCTITLISLVTLVYPQCWVHHHFNFNFRIFSPSLQGNQHPLTVTPHCLRELILKLVPVILFLWSKKAITDLLNWKWFLSF